MQVSITRSDGRSTKLFGLRSALRDLLIEDITDAIEQDLSTLKWTFDDLADFIDASKSELMMVLYPVDSPTPYVGDMDMAKLLRFPFWREHTQLLIVKIIKFDDGDMWV